MAASTVDVTKLLEKLKCTECEYYLSCGPVYIKNEDGEAICGRCGKPEKEPVTQNKQYEAVAELLHFPCKYSEFGCEEKLNFSQKNSNPHEAKCDFRQRLCPIAESGKCEWLGAWKDLLEHCKEDHPELVLENPCSIRHDISKSSLINYLLVAFNLLFILHTKVCCSTGKIFHAIRLLGDSENVEDFEYKLNITRNRERIRKYGKVAPEGCLTIQENTSLGLTTNSLLEIFGGNDDMEFNIKLKQQNGINYCSTCSSNSSNSSSAKISSTRRSSSNSNSSSNSSDSKTNIIFCKNKESGCEYSDIDEDKCLKHETYYCNFNTKCTYDKYTEFCNNNIEQGTLFEHLVSNHEILIKSIDTVIRCSRDENKRLLLTSNIGIIVVEYCEEGLYHTFNIYSPLTSSELELYNCNVELTLIGRETVRPEVLNLYETKVDWSFSYFISEVEFDIKVSINKNE